MKRILSILLLSSFVAYIFTQNQLITPTMDNAGDYFRKVLQATVKKIETMQITGKGLPINDVTGFINTTGIGLTIIGDVHFHSGFVVKIEEIILNPQGFVESGAMLPDYAQVEGSLLMKNLVVAYDVKCDFNDYKRSGSVYIVFDALRFKTNIKRMHATLEMSAVLEFESIISQNNIIVITSPDDPHFQMIAKNFKRTYDFRDVVLQNFRNWTLGNTLLDTAKEYGFPEFIYY